MIVGNNNFKFATKCEFFSKTWFDIGKLLYNLSQGSEEGFKLWIVYSKTDSEKYNESYCCEIWKNDFDDVDPLPEGW